MTSSPVSPPCPNKQGGAHYWLVTIVRVDGVGYYRHTCRQCGATKDVDVASTNKSAFVPRITRKKS